MDALFKDKYSEVVRAEVRDYLPALCFLWKNPEVPVCDFFSQVTSLIGNTLKEWGTRRLAVRSLSQSVRLPCALHVESSRRSPWLSSGGGGINCGSGEFLVGS